MIDPATAQLVQNPLIRCKQAITVENIAKEEWFSRYPWPTQVTFDRGSEFIGQ
jgi:hypothetical protein